MPAHRRPPVLTVLCHGWCNTSRNLPIPRPVLAGVPRPQAVTLDLFGTLVDFSVQRDEPPLVADLLDEAGIHRDPENVLAVWLTASLDERGRLPFRTVHTALVRGAQRMTEELDLAVDPGTWADALEDRWAASPLHDDVPVALDRLDAAGIPYGLVTNLDRAILERTLANTGLDQRVEVAVCSEAARAYKPHPRVFELALKQLDALPHQAIHVGDSRTEDLAGARAVGMGWRLVRDGHGTLEEAVEAILAGTEVSDSPS